MKFQSLSVFSLSLLLLAGCEEAASNRKKGENGIRTPVTKETVTAVSGVHRERGTAPVTYASEISANGENSNIRPVPDIHFDDEGADGTTVSTRQSKGRPTALCGLDKAAKLKEKIADCALASKNGMKATWNGTTEAGSAEAIWTLVTLAEKETADGKYEVWLDTRTGMVWTDIILLEANWCGASGNKQEADDVIGENCSSTGNAKSFCTDLNLAELPKVAWRLPTRHDYLQADIDGIRFVLKQGTNNYWTATVATVKNEKRDKAWTYNMANGTLSAELMNSKRHVRCIGTPNF